VEGVWRELVEALDPEASFTSAAPEKRLAGAEARLGSKLPPQLRGLLGETDGIEGKDGLGVIWPLSRIVHDNERFRTNEAAAYMPFCSLLFFADAGNGDQFAFPVTATQATRDEVFAWDHEDDSRKWFAPSLREYLEGWLSGELKL
jgi:hypothetical protein